MCQNSEVPCDKHVKTTGGAQEESLHSWYFSVQISGIIFSLPMTHHIPVAMFNTPHPRGKANSMVTVT